MIPPLATRVWTVRAMGKKAKVIAHYGTCMAEATLTGPNVPDGWRVIPHDLLVERLALLLDNEPTASPS
jgi:hypothetical protein